MTGMMDAPISGEAPPFEELRLEDLERWARRQSDSAELPLRDWVAANPNLVPHPEAVLADLDGLAKILKDAEHIGVRFHFALQNPMG